MIMLIRRFGALVCLAAAVCVALLGFHVASAFLGYTNLLISGPRAALVLVATFVLYILVMFAFGLLLSRGFRVRGLGWGAFALAGAPIPLFGYAIVLGGDDAGDPMFLLMLYILLAGYALYAAGLMYFGRRLAARGDLPRGLKSAGVMLAAAGGFYIAHAAIAVLATTSEGAVFPLVALILMVAGGAIMALAEATIGIVMWRQPRPRGV